MGKGNLRKFFCDTVGEKFCTGNVVDYVNRTTGLFLSVHEDEIKLARKTDYTERLGKFS